MVAFVKAKEEFKHKKTLPGILYSDVIRLVSRKKIKYSIKNSILIWQFFFCRHSFSVPYFHYLEDNRLMWQRNGGQHQLHVVICVHGLGWYSFSRKKIFNYLKIQFWFDEILFLEFQMEILPIWDWLKPIWKLLCQGTI